MEAVIRIPDELAQRLQEVADENHQALETVIRTALYAQLSDPSVRVYSLRGGLIQEVSWPRRFRAPADLAARAAALNAQLVGIVGRARLAQGEQDLPPGPQGQARIEEPVDLQDRPRRRFALTAIGASGSTRGGAEADELLAEGFGRD